jgi:hypothetical protein
MREVGFIRDFALVWAAWRFSSRIAALARRPSGRFADFSEIGVIRVLCLKLVGRRVVA